jgi:NAD(P)-dependent dehydrogenase (short-subunit alcohol dehydrogenase family)
MTMKLKDKTALVTGGGRGIGKAIALALAREGANVAVTGRHEDVLQEVAKEIAAMGRRSLAFVADVSDEQQVQRLFDATKEKFDCIDLLINNVGIAGPTAPLVEVTSAEWDETMTVNLRSAFLCSRAAIPQMVERGGGKIINISSIAGKIGYALRSPYATSKWGMIGLSQSLAQELGRYNIQVNTICPGPTDGERMRAVIAHRARELGKTEAEVEAVYVEGTALKRMVDPDHVAAAVVFLASNAGDSITGVALDVAAGFAI